MELFYGHLDSAGLMTLSPEDSAHCVRVLRHRIGDSVSVIDGSGVLYSCTLKDDNPKAAVASVDSVREGFGSHPYRLTMAVCPTKNIDRYEWFVQKATEFGVDVIVPVVGDRSERRTVNPDRMEKILLSAAKQSMKGRIPEFAPLQSVRDFILAADPSECNLIAYCHGERKPVTTQIEDKPINVLIGPEGDFSPEEIELALGRGFRSVSLGESRLRTETAALAAVAAVYFSKI